MIKLAPLCAELIIFFYDNLVLINLPPSQNGDKSIKIERITIQQE